MALTLMWGKVEVCPGCWSEREADTGLFCQLMFN